MGRADLHIHSTHSDGMAGVPQLLAYAEAETALDIIAIADHDQVAGALQAVEWCAGRPGGRLQAVVGTEISVAWGRHVLALFFREPYPSAPFPRFRSLETTLGMVADAGGMVVVPHPLSVLVPSLGARVLAHHCAGERRHAALAGVEVCSGVIGGRRQEARIRRCNETLWHLASLGNSDAHHVEQLGTAYTLFTGRTIDDLERAIAAQATQAHWGPPSTIQVTQHARQAWRSLVIKPARELCQAFGARGACTG